MLAALQTQANIPYVQDLGTDWTIVQSIPKHSSESVAAMLQYIVSTYGKLLAILTNNGEEFMLYHVQNVLHHLKI